VLRARGYHLYSDFSFMQMPYQPMLWSAILPVQGGLYLLACKLVNYLTWVVVCAAFGCLAYRTTRSRAFTACAVALFVLNDTILRGAVEASNYIAPVLAATLAYWLVFAEGATSWRTAARHGVAGLLLGGCIGLRLYYLTAAVTVAAIVLFAPRSSGLGDRLKRGFAPLVLGIAAGLLPALLQGARGWRAFWFFNYVYHQLNTAQYRIEGYQQRMTLASKAGFMLEELGQGHNVLLLCVVAFMVALSIKQAKSVIAWVRAAPLALLGSGLLFAVTLLTALVPTPSWPQYYAMVLPFVFLMAVALFQTLSDDNRRIASLLVGIVALGTLVTTAPWSMKGIAMVSKMQSWSPIRLYDSAQRIKSTLRAAGIEGKVATFATLQAIEADLPIYLELSNSYFLYRVGDQLDPAALTRYKATSPSQVGSLLERDPPAAILVRSKLIKVPTEYEVPMVQYATRHRYERIDDPKLGGVLFIRGRRDPKP
jgi:hypothetical protein